MKHHLNGHSDIAVAICPVTRVRQLNDTFCGGRVVVTRSVADLPEVDQATVLEQVRTFSAFSADNDPHGEHGRAGVARNAAALVQDLDRGVGVGGIPTQGDEVRHLLGINAVARAYFRRADPRHFASRRRLRTGV